MKVVITKVMWTKYSLKAYVVRLGWFRHKLSPRRPVSGKTGGSITCFSITLGWMYVHKGLLAVCDITVTYRCPCVSTGWSCSIWREGGSWIQTQRLQICWGSSEKSAQHQPTGWRGDQHSSWHQHSAVWYLRLEKQAGLICNLFYWK